MALKATQPVMKLKLLLPASPGLKGRSSAGSITTCASSALPSRHSCPRAPAVLGKEKGPVNQTLYYIIVASARRPTSPIIAELTDGYARQIGCHTRLIDY